MFTGAEMLLISGGLNATGTLMSMGALSGADKLNAIIADTNAKLAKMDAEQAAVDARRRGQETAGAARSSLAASGVDVAGGGSVDDIEREITRQSERDAYAALLQGDRQADAFRQQARDMRRSARDTTLAGALKIGETVMGTAYGIDKWQRGMEA